MSTEINKLIDEGVRLRTIEQLFDTIEQAGNTLKDVRIVTFYGQLELAYPGAFLAINLRSIPDMLYLISRIRMDVEIEIQRRKRVG